MKYIFLIAVFLFCAKSVAAQQESDTVSVAAFSFTSTTYNDPLPIYTDRRLIGMKIDYVKLNGVDVSSDHYIFDDVSGKISFDFYVGPSTIHLMYRKK